MHVCDVCVCAHLLILRLQRLCQVVEAVLWHLGQVAGVVPHEKRHDWEVEEGHHVVLCLARVEVVGRLVHLCWGVEVVGQSVMSAPLV